MSLLTEARKLTKYWQKQLRLLDWDIQVENVFDDIDKFNSFGETKISENHQYARISLLDPCKIPDMWVGCRDMEVTIVHEILHVRLTYCFDNKGDDDSHKELAIEQLARVMVALKRGISTEELV